MSDEKLYQEEPPKESVKSFIWETVKIVIVCLIIVLPLRAYVIQPFYVKGASMEPNFYDHEYLIINEIGYHLGNPVRGDIIVFKHNDAEQSYYIKRVIGLPGERVVIKDNEIYIYNQQNPDGFKLNESEYLPKTTTTDGEIDVRLKNNEYYVLGDNRMSSLDSRRFGPITRDTIVGKTWLRGWPFDKFKVFETPSYQ
ncbi:MAG: signal peptidase I [Patescibacteria group bacterium]|nr:signal peptidase I [Patescibacteria group bacterium]